MFFRISSVYIVNNIYNIISSYMRSSCRALFSFNYFNKCNLFMGNGCRSDKLHLAVEANFVEYLEYNYGNYNNFKKSHRIKLMHCLPVSCAYGLQFRIECL